MLLYGRIVIQDLFFGDWGGVMYQQKCPAEVLVLVLAYRCSFITTYYDFIYSML